MGFHSKKALFMLAIWEVFYRPGVWARDPDSQSVEILARPGREDDRIDALRARIEALAPETLRPLAIAAPSRKRILWIGASALGLRQ